MSNTGTINGIRLFDIETTSDIRSKMIEVYRNAKILFDATPKLPVDYPEQAKTKIYLAGPWFDSAMELYYDYVERIVNYSKRCSKYDVFFPRRQPHNSPSEVFKNNIREINNADVVIALISRKDVGTAFELGLAYALNKPIYLVGYDISCFLSHTNIMLAYSGLCFTVDNLARYLTDQAIDFVHIDDGWEGKE